MTKTTSIALQVRTKTGAPQDNDYGSELDILPSLDGDHGITKTVNMHVVEEEGQINSLDYSHGFDSGELGKEAHV